MLCITLFCAVLFFAEEEVNESENAVQGVYTVGVTAIGPEKNIKSSIENETECETQWEDWNRQERNSVVFCKQKHRYKFLCKRSSIKREWKSFCLGFLQACK